MSRIGCLRAAVDDDADPHEAFLRFRERQRQQASGVPMREWSKLADREVDMPDHEPVPPTPEQQAAANAIFDRMLRGSAPTADSKLGSKAYRRATELGEGIDRLVSSANNQEGVIGGEATGGEQEATRDPEPAVMDPAPNDDQDATRDPEAVIESNSNQDQNVEAAMHEEETLAEYLARVRAKRASQS